VKRSGRALTTALVAGAFWIGLVPLGDAQPTLRIGASLSQTGRWAAIGQIQLRAYQLCVKHTNDKGGLLGRKLELVVEDDQSEPATAARIYEKLITQDRVHAVLGPFSSVITESVADVAEKHRMVLVAPTAGVTSIYKKGRRFVFMMYSPSEVYLEGLIDMAAKRGLKTVALIHEDDAFGKAVVQEGLQLAKKRGLSVVLVEAYPRRATDFSAILAKVRAASADVLGAGANVANAVTLTRQLKELTVNAKMFALLISP
jgi:branched-chain amino acid transport system substrate-binding protein